MELKEIGELYDRHARHLKQFIGSRVSTEEDAEDILHETFIRMSDANPSLKIGDARKYLFTIARNIIIDRARRPKLFVSEASKDEEIPEWPADQPALDEKLAIERDMKTLEAAIMSLSKRCQQAFVMRVFHGYSHAEIANHMNISVKTVEKHLTKGFMVCRHYMNKSAVPAGVYPKGSPKGGGIAQLMS